MNSEKNGKFCCCLWVIVLACSLTSSCSPSMLIEPVTLPLTAIKNITEAVTGPTISQLTRPTPFYKTPYGQTVRKISTYEGTERALKYMDDHPIPAGDPYYKDYLEYYSKLKERIDISEKYAEDSKRFEDAKRIYQEGYEAFLEGDMVTAKKKFNTVSTLTVWTAMGSGDDDLNRKGDILHKIAERKIAECDEKLSSRR
jgi:hypothetical protein